MLYTTLTQLKEYNASPAALRTLTQSLPETHQETDPIPLMHILESNGLEHAIWALRTQGKYENFLSECKNEALYRMLNDPAFLEFKKQLFLKIISE